ncbi:hypothetical protein H1O16_gp193 [Burkholderia phage BcepSaruman]|uniref:Uncharacterized protein n=1 Tax=Burkholderia phage BcepSaruman TaxID=2530032 RepID=A0A4D5ZDH3_9CAUD|nr:hypothetical protein H1O16_gp193 [Burkholderia phage BcepSaruman]QBX06606.1 hypothetical protein BcepSaruman_193 [Burkholderia phage BcepSaruman]
MSHSNNPTTFGENGFYSREKTRQALAAFPEFVPLDATKMGIGDAYIPRRLERLLKFLRLKDHPTLAPIQDWTKGQAIDNLLNPDYHGPFFVINTSNTSGYVAHSPCQFADLLVKRYNPNGSETSPFKIPATWLPLDIRLHIVDLRNNKSFQRLLDLELVTVVSPERAAAILETPEAKAEASRLHDLEAARREGGRRAFIAEITTVY